tara:strand:- start:575 stop:823 length:249 start_codon:yes stop_codon:yes gene_type:complete
MKKGTKIYYTGDMANIEGFGTVTRAYEDKWGKWVDIKMDDGRDFANTTAHTIGNVYKGHCNPRLVTKDAYDAYRAEVLKQYN